MHFLILGVYKLKSSRTIFHDLTVEEADSSCGEVGIVLRVSNHDDGGAFSVEFLQQVHHLHAVLGV